MFLWMIQGLCSGVYWKKTRQYPDTNSHTHIRWKKKLASTNSELQTKNGEIVQSDQNSTYVTKVKIIINYLTIYN